MSKLHKDAEDAHNELVSAMSMWAYRHNRLMHASEVGHIYAAAIAADYEARKYTRKQRKASKTPLLWNA